LNERINISIAHDDPRLAIVATVVLVQSRGPYYA
jgi:hypothetical protein